MDVQPQRPDIDAIGRLAGRKNGLAIIAIGAIVLLREQSWEVLVLVTGLTALTITYQFLLDIAERRWLGKDLPEGNGGNGGEGVRRAVGTGGNSGTDGVGVVASELTGGLGLKGGIVPER